MPASDLVNLSGLLDDAKCFALVRQLRWPEGVRCPGCGSDGVIRDGCDDTQPHRQRYRCKACAGRFDDLTGTALAGHHQPLRVWVLCLYFMGLNLSNRQIALELGLNASDVQAMTEHLRRGLVARAPAAQLEGEVEIDEVYGVAGHSGPCRRVSGAWPDARIAEAFAAGITTVERVRQRFVEEGFASALSPSPAQLFCPEYMSGNLLSGIRSSCTSRTC